MVVAAYDAAALAQGSTPNAIGDVPLDALAELPTADNAAVPFVVTDDASAATDVSEPADAEPVDPTIALRAEIQADEQAKAEARFQQDKANLQRAHAQQLRPLQDQVSDLNARLSVAHQAISQRWQDEGLDEQEMQDRGTLLRAKQDEASNTTRARVQQAESGYANTVSYMVNRIPQVYQEIEQGFGATGLFTDADRQQDLQWIATNLDPAYRDLHYKFGGDLNSPAGLYLKQVHPQLREMQTARAAQRFAAQSTQAQAAAEAAKAAEAAARAQANRDKAVARGPQSTATNGGGGGGVDTKSLEAEAWNLFPHPADGEKARMQHIANALYSQLPQPRR